jgi:hypothetical protein
MRGRKLPANDLQRIDSQTRHKKKPPAWLTGGFAHRPLDAAGGRPAYWAASTMYWMAAFN